jgi:hypothetical protein
MAPVEEAGPTAPGASAEGKQTKEEGSTSPRRGRRTNRQRNRRNPARSRSDAAAATATAAAANADSQGRHEKLKGFVFAHGQKQTEQFQDTLTEIAELCGRDMDYGQDVRRILEHHDEATPPLVGPARVAPRDAYEKEVWLLEVKDLSSCSSQVPAVLAPQ